VRVLYVGKHGSDSNDGVNAEKALLTFTQAVTLAAALVPSATSRVAIVCEDAGRYVEDVTLAQYVSIHAPQATIVGKITTADDSVLWLGYHRASANNQDMLYKPNAQTGTSYCYITELDGRDYTAVANVRNDADNGVLFLTCAKLWVGANGAGIGDQSGAGGFGHIHVEVEDLYLAGNNAVGIQGNQTSANIIARIGHVLETGSPSSTTAIRVGSTGNVYAVAAEIIADTVWNVSGAGLLFLNCLRRTGSTQGSATVPGDVVQSGSYANPSWITSLGWSKLTGTPTTIAGYGITDAPTKTGTGASGTWGISITGDAATLGGLSLASGTAAPGVNKIIRTQANGYTFLNYINSDTGNDENPATVGQIIVTNGADNYYRKASLSHLATKMGAWASTTRPGPYRLFRRDDNSNFSVQTHWTNTYWRLAGYSSGDNFHAQCSVYHADIAGSATNATYAEQLSGAPAVISSNVTINGNASFTARNAMGTAAWSAAMLMMNGATAAGGQYGIVIRDSNNSNVFYTENNGTVWARNGVTSSDSRLKKNIASVNDPLSRIRPLTLREYALVDDDNSRIRYGVVAQEAMQYVPELVVEGNFPPETEDSEPVTRYLFDYTSLFALCLGAIQQLDARISSLEGV
jgi:hypothetical protein